MLWRTAALLVALLCFMQTAFSSSAPKMNIVVTVRGKKYPIEAATVREVQREIKDKAGLDPDQQAVLFQGKMLGEDAGLATSGVADGDTLNIVPHRASRQSKQSAQSFSAANLGADDEEPAIPRPSSAAPSQHPGEMARQFRDKMREAFQAGGALDGLQDDLKNFATLDPKRKEEVMDKVQTVMKEQLGGDLDMNKLMQLSNSLIWSLLRSPIIETYLADYEAMDKLRVQAKQAFENAMKQPEYATVLKQFQGAEAMEPLLSDTNTFIAEIRKLVEVYKAMPDPGAGGGGELDWNSMGQGKGDDLDDDLDMDDLDKDL